MLDYESYSPVNGRYTPKAVAELLRLHVVTIRGRIRDGSMPGLDVGTARAPRYHIDGGELIRWIEERSIS